MKWWQHFVTPGWAPFWVPKEPERKIWDSESKLLLPEPPESPRPPNSIVRIVGYKLDCFTFDQVVLELVFKDGYQMDVLEASSDFRSIINELEKIPGFQHELYSQVLYPPFEECLTTLLDLESQETAC